MKKNNLKKVVLITRIKLINEKQEIEDFLDWHKVFLKNENVVKIYILSDQLSKDNLEPELNKDDKKTKFIISSDPTSPISVNLAIEKIAPETDYFIIASKEIKIEEKDIDELKNEIKANDNFLVVGYKFRIKDNDKLDKELQNYYKDKSLVAYRVPWNTCAIWRYKTFKDYVGKFDSITHNANKDKIWVCIDNVCRQTDHKGMEDGLAIAKASANRREEIKFKLLKKRLTWDLGDDYNICLEHRRKLARKDVVMRDFMAIRNYSEKDLEKANISK